MRRAACAAVLALVAAIHSLAAAAGSFQIEPLQVRFSHAGEIQAVRIRNAGDAPLVLQVEAVSWTQANGEDRYEPTRGLLATPPMVQIPPDAEQIVRVALRDAAPTQAERAYRLYFHEVPAAPPADFRGLRVALRVGIPVFVAPSGVSIAPTAKWRVVRAANDRLRLSVTNDGSSHLHLHSIAALTQSDMPLFRDGPAYVLPGMTRTWQFDAAPDGVRQSDRAQRDRAQRDRAQRLRVRAPSNVSDEALDLAIEQR